MMKWSTWLTCHRRSVVEKHINGCGSVSDNGPISVVYVCGVSVCMCVCACVCVCLPECGLF